MAVIPTGYCECGCGEKTRVPRWGSKEKGWVKGVPLRFVNGHNARKSPYEYLIDEKTDCWIWQRSVNDDGYGHLGRNGKTVGAHRVFYEEANGPIPEGLDLDHLCHSRDKSCPGGRSCLHRRCVNPDHMEPVVRAVNVQRGRNAKLTPTQVGEIRSLCREGWVQQDIADAYGIGQSHVSAIALGVKWAV